MTVLNTSEQINYDGDGVTGVFSFPFPVKTASQVVAKRINKTTRATVETYVQGSGANQFQVTINTSSEGGSIALGATAIAALTSSFEIQINRVTPGTQQTKIPPVTRLDEKKIEEAFDRLAMRSIEQEAGLNSAIRLADTVLGVDGLITQAPVAGAAIILNDDADGFIFGPTADEISGAAASANAAAASATAAESSADAAEQSALDAAESANRLTGTSTTSVAIATGTKVFTTQADKQFNGQNVRVYSAANVANFMDGLATYSGTSLSVDVATIGGSGTFTDWVIKVNGAKGADGPAGPAGEFDAIAANSILANATGSSAVPSAVPVAASRLVGRTASSDIDDITISEALDLVGSAADGDILIRSGGSWTRLGIGSSGQGLVVSSGLPAWGTTGGLVWLGAQNITTATANVDLFTQFDNTLYGAYIITGTGIVLGTSGATLNTQFSRDKSTIVTTDYFAANGIIDTNGTIGADTAYITTGGAQGAGGVPLIHGAQDDSNQVASTFEMKIFNDVARNTGLIYRHDFPQVDMTAATTNMAGANTVRYRTIKGMFKGTQVGGQQVNGVRFKASSGNITQGKFTIYGIRKV